MKGCSSATCHIYEKKSIQRVFCHISCKTFKYAQRRIFRFFWAHVSNLKRDCTDLNVNFNQFTCSLTIVNHDTSRIVADKYFPFFFFDETSSAKVGNMFESQVIFFYETFDDDTTANFHHYIQRHESNTPLTPRPLICTS